MILGERENIVAGIDGSFTLNAAARQLHAQLPERRHRRRRARSRSPATGSPPSTRRLGSAPDEGRPPATSAYVDEQTAKLLAGTARRSSPRSRPATSQKAKELFGPARRHYEAIEPVAESFGDLDPEIDARVNDVADPGRVDRLPPHRADPLGRRTRPTGTAPYATKLLADVTTLRPPRRDARATSPRSSPTARSSCSTRSRARRSPARRTATRTPTSPTSRPTSTGARRAFELLRPALADARQQALAATIAAALRRRPEGARHATSAPTPLGYAHLRRADRRRPACSSRSRSTRSPSRSRRSPRRSRANAVPGTQLMSAPPPASASAGAQVAGGGAIGWRGRLPATPSARASRARRQATVVPFYGDAPGRDRDARRRTGSCSPRST